MKLPLRMGSEEARRFGNQALPQTPFSLLMEGWERGKKDGGMGGRKERQDKTKNSQITHWQG
jgi:hypothetical protein